MAKVWINQLKVLFWKNWIRFKRHKVRGAFELFHPIIYILFFLILRELEEKSAIEARSSQEISINSPLCQYQSEEITKIVFAPKNEFYGQLMGNVVRNFNVDLIAVTDELHLNAWIENQTEPVAAVVFEEVNGDPPKHLKYTIRMPDDISSSTRWDTDKLYYSGISKEPRPNNLSPKSSLYYSTCFLKLQNEIDQAFIKSLNKGTSFEKLDTIKTFPYPAVEVDIFVTFAAYGFPILFVLSMIFSAKVLIKNITIERESRLTESMRIMGLSSALYWSSWFMRSFIILIISFTINLILTVTSIISDVPMFANSNPLIIWFFFISYITSMITFCFLVSVIFKKSSRAGIVGSIVFIATVLPYIMYHDSFYRFGYGLKVLFCMLTNTNMGQGIKMILMAEVNDDGVGFGNLFKRSVDSKFSFGELLVWMNIGSAMLMLLTIYIEKIVYEELDVAKPWKILFKYINGKIVKKSADSLHDDVHHSSSVQEMGQLFPSSNQRKKSITDEIEIKELSRKFGNEYAVHDLSLILKRNQIAVLLGLKGVGKTTVVSLLNGLLKQTSGTAVINGFDIRSDTDEARRSIGVCPQHDAFLEDLTAQENLEFFCKLKGMEDIEVIQKDIEKYVKSLGIDDSLSSPIKALNHEQKSKLSISIALCGDSKFVILDEPTSGMDPSSRRLLWDLLIVEKKNRTILVTAHFMDEADVLGDRIAIMSQGRLLAVESLPDFKKKFGIGYRLTCAKQYGFRAQAVLDVIDNAVKEARMEKIASDIPETEAETVSKSQGFGVESESVTEVVVMLPEEELPTFDKIFKSLDDFLEKLKISSYKLSYRSIEDVVNRLPYLNLKNEGKPADDSEYQAVVNIQEPEKEFQKCDKKVEIFQQFYAMFLKKLYVLQQSWTTFLVLGVLSIFIIILIPTLFYVRSNLPTRLPISLDSYEGTDIFVDIDHNSSIAGHYLKLINSLHKKTIVPNNSITKALNESVNRKDLIAVTFKKDEIIAWFNTQPYHTMPLTVNTINRAILKSIAGNDYDILVINHPYYSSIEDSRDDLILDFLKMLLPLIIWPMIYIGYYIKERELRFKFLQFICGTNRLVFWFTNLIFDYILFILICLVLFGCIVCFNYDKEQRLDEFRILMTVGSSYGFSWICFIYAFSYLFSKPSSGETMLLFTSIILFIMSAIDYVLQTWLENQFYKFLAKIYHWIGLMLAPFTLVRMLQNIIFGSRPLDHPQLAECVILNVVSGCIFFLVVLSFDYNLLAIVSNKFRKSSNRLSLVDQKLDEEASNISAAEDTTESIQTLRELLKVYKNIHAVHQLTLKYEHNQADKTIFKIISGNEDITSGDIWIKRKCPKTMFNNFLPELTGRETLKIFALLCGFKMDEIVELVNQVGIKAELLEYCNKQVKLYDGQLRRKLISALAELGNPDLIFLDECTTGVDPQARRQIWNAIKRIRDNHRLSSSIVITSHSMDECEALCTRIGIMVAGQFQCLGPVQHLKNKFSKGFVLTIKTGFTDEERIRKVRKRIVQKFLDVELKEQYLDILTFHLKNDKMALSEIFKILAEVKLETCIKHYAVTHMSLEQMLLSISKQDTPFTQEEVAQISKEEGMWRKEEEDYIKAKVKYELEKEKEYKKKARIKANQIARRKTKKLKQQELDQQELNQLELNQQELDQQEPDQLEKLEVPAAAAEQIIKDDMNSKKRWQMFKHAVRSPFKKSKVASEDQQAKTRKQSAIEINRKQQRQDLISSNRPIQYDSDIDSSDDE